MPRSALSRLTAVASVLLLCALAGAPSAYGQKNVLQPSDAIIPSSSNSPGSEGVINAIDGTQAKYLNFDNNNNAKPSGFVVTPQVGPTILSGLAMQSANDAPERDPKSVRLEGSNDDTITDFNSGNWEIIYENPNVPVFTARYQTQTFFFDNYKAYKHYRWTVLLVQNAPSTANSMQIAEVQLLGTAVPKNVLQPSDAILPSSSNSPGSEGVVNAIDGTQAKYLNFDNNNNAKPSGFVVTPSVGATLVTGLAMQSANDAPERDPKSVRLEGSNDDTITDFNSGNWTVIYENSNVPVFTARYQTQTFFFPNYQPYKHYRWTVLLVQNAPSTANSMQIAEVQLLGSGAPKNALQPSDAIIASSSNSPGSEGVINAIDGTQAKYLNFDNNNNAKPSGFVVTPSVGPTTVIGLAMQSANDAPERDPKSVRLEGSNDDTITDFNSGNWTLIYENTAVPAFTARYQTQTFYFPNRISYKHYRWTVLLVQNAPSTANSMQIAEVQLLAVTTQTDCSKASFLVQPVDTPVLPGSSATFFVTVNGPWPLQWYKGTNAIPGATGTSYTTDPVTTANADTVYSVQIVGCEMSTPVKAVLFNPSATKSIGIHFGGGGANGAPTYMLPEDIAGIHLQAHWNNVTNDSVANGYTADGVTQADTLVDSSGDATPITFEYSTNGRWGAGTGSDSPTQRMLNGIAGANAPGEANVGTFTFHGVPAGTHSLLVYSVSPPAQFQLNRFTLGSTTYYMRSMNSDEYKAAPGFYRGLSTDQANPTVGDFIRFDNVQAVGGDITLNVECLTPGFDQRTGVNALQLLLNAASPGAPPVITQQPVQTVGPAGGTVRLSVTATGENLTYQWRKNGRNLPNGGGVSGATTPTLTLSDFGEADVGVYSVAVFNPAGSVVSANAAVFISKYNIQDALVGYWKLDETSGTAVANSAPGGKPGQVFGTPNWVKGQVANGFSFDGGTYLFEPDYTKATKQIAGQAWVNVAPGAYDNEVIFRNAQGALTVSGGGTRIVGQFELRLVFNGETGALNPEAAIGIGPNVSRVTSPTPISTGVWHHLAFSADGAQLRLYVDGNQVAFGDYLADINPPDIPYISFGARLNLADPADPSSDLVLDPTTPYLLMGQLDEVALWTRALTPSEVSLLYAAGKGGQPLTTVVETPPTTDLGSLTVSAAGGNITVTWAQGTLQTAPSVNGPWTDSTAKSPLVEGMTDQAKFYRAIAR